MVLSIPCPKLYVPIQLLEQQAFEPFGTVINDPNLQEATSTGATQESKGTFANQGSAIKYAHVTRLSNYYDEQAPSRIKAQPSVSLFHCYPRLLRDSKDVENRVQDGGPASPRDHSTANIAVLAKKGGLYDVSILERHPFTSQTFVPMGCPPADPDRMYLVIVAPTIQSPVQDGRSGEPILQRPKGSGMPDLVRMKAFLARGDQAVTYAAGTWHAPMAVLGSHPIDFVVWQYANNVPDEDCQEVELRAHGQDPEGAAVVIAPADERLTILAGRPTSTMAKL